MDAAGQNQHAGEIATGVGQIERGLQRTTWTFEREAIRVLFSGAGADFSRAFGRVEATIAQDAAEAYRDIEVGFGPASG